MVESGDGRCEGNDALPDAGRIASALGKAVQTRGSPALARRAHFSDESGDRFSN